jgi:hypothetical protein
LARVSDLFYLGVSSWKDPAEVYLDALKRGVRAGLETGDVEFALVNAIAAAFNQYERCPLRHVEAEYVRAKEQIVFYGHEAVLTVTKPMLQTIHNLTGRAHGNVNVLTGEIMNEEELREFRRTNETLFIFAHFHKMLLSYLFGEVDKAASFSKIIQPMIAHTFGALDAALGAFLDGLVAVAQARKAKKRRSPQAMKQLRRIRYFATHAPQLFLCRQFLLEAELSALSGSDKVVHSKYICAISLSRDHGYLLPAALSNELAGKYYLQKGDMGKAKTFLEEAVCWYTRWEATAKVVHLRNEIKAAFPNLPIQADCNSHK